MPTSSASASIRAHVLAGVLLVTGGVGGFAGFAATAELSSAIVASGTVVPESRRKTVQHLEGGIVAEIRVRDADAVRAGDVLVRLDGTRAVAAAAALRGQLAIARAVAARLEAEAAGAPAVAWPPDLRRDPGAAAAIAAETAAFADGRRSLDNQIAILASRRTQLAHKAEGLARQHAALADQLASLEAESAGLAAITEKGFHPKARLAAHGRAVAELRGALGEVEADRAGAATQQAETDLQILQIRQAARERASDALGAARGLVSDTAEKLRVAEDTLARLDVRAPQDGIVQGLSTVTVGGVIRPGEPILDIVPAGDAPVVQARIPVTGIDELVPGMTAELRFPAFQARVMPLVTGQVATISADAVFDETSRQSFYVAGVTVDAASLPAELAGRLHPGMPAEVVVPTRARTLLDYIVEPLTGLMSRAMRES